MQRTSARAFLSTCFAVVAGLTILLGARPAPDAGSSLMPASAALDCNALCFTVCAFEDEHAAPYWSGQGASGAYDGYHQPCAAGTCADDGGEQHPPCQGLATLLRSGDYDRFVLALQTADDPLVAEIMSKHPKSFVLNAKRQSIQVLGCRGESVANHPVSTQQLQSLAAAQ